MSSARKALRRGTILLQGKEAKCITTASPGDVIELQTRVQPGFTPNGKPPSFSVPVVFEDDSIAVVHKPAGVCTQPPPGGSQSGSMRTAIQHVLKPPPIGTQYALYRPQCVHRLDKATSGLLLCAKTKPALLSLQQSFRERTVQKRYAAIVAGYVEGESGFIDAPIEQNGKTLSAQTEWTVTQRARSLKLGGGHLTFLSLRPRTGRTHQLRKHCAFVLGCPIVGDKKYGSQNKKYGGDKKEDDARSGMYLAALELTLRHPDRPPDAPLLNVVIEPPDKFGSLLSREQRRWEELGGEDGVEAAAGFYEDDDNASLDDTITTW